MPIRLSNCPFEPAARVWNTAENDSCPTILFARGEFRGPKMAGTLGSPGLKIGICWRGNPDPKADPSRSIPLACFAKTANDGVRLVSPQKQGDDETLPGLIMPSEDFDAGPDAFIDTAAIMQILDLIVTCDTSIAHLAGALGRPVWFY